MIYLNLIPSNLWYLNLRKILGQQEWTKLSLATREKFNWECYCCNISIKKLKQKKFFDAHEYWFFDREKKVVSLKAIICVCKKCHAAIHMGYSSINNQYDSALKHLQKVNKWSFDDAKNYIEWNFEEWAKNSKINWKFDLNSFNQWLNTTQLEIVYNFFRKK